MISYFVDNPKVTSLIVIVIIIAGLMGAYTMNREAFPAVDFAQIKITTVYPGATPEDVEIRVTKKIEDEIREIDGVKEIRSTSQESLSEIIVEVDMDNAVQKVVVDEIQRAVDRVVDLPLELTDPPHFQEMKTTKLPVLEVSVVGEVGEMTLRETADKLKETFELTDGVSGVNKIGYRDREYLVNLDPKKMEQFHIGFQEVINTIRANNINQPGGVFESRPYEMAVRTVDEFKNVDDLQNVVIRSNFSGQAVRIKDIAKIDDTFGQPKVITRTNGRPSIILVVRKKEFSDIIQVTASLKKELSDFKLSLPNGVEIITSSDESIRAKNRLEIVLSNSMIGFVFLLISLVLFLNFKTALVTSISLPIVILCTLFVMSALDISFNIVSMLAIIIALGMFVDNSIVISENIYRLTQDGIPLREAAIQGTKEIAAPITATVLTTIAAFAPMLVTTGLMGKMIWAIPVIVSASLIASLGESFFLLPTRVLMFGKSTKSKELTWFAKFQEIFEKMLSVLLKHKWKSIFCVNLLLLAAILFAIFKLDFVLFAPEGTDSFAIKYQAAPGTPIEDVHEAAKKIETILLTLPKSELIAVTTRTGIHKVGARDPLERVRDNIGMILVYLTPENDRDRTADEIIAELRKLIPTKELFQTIQFQKVIVGPPLGKPVTITIQGDDLDTLKVAANEIKQYLKSIDGVVDIDQDVKLGLKQLRVNLKKGVTEEVGLTVADIANTLRIAHEGVIASTIRNFKDDIDIRVLLSKEARGDRDILQNILISDQRQNLIPLHEVAIVTEEEGSEVRKHLDYRRAITVAADIDASKITSIEANKLIRQNFESFPEKYPGYDLKFGGEEKSTKESVASLARAMVIAVIGIFVILVALFKSFAKPLLVMYSIPFGFIGTIIGFALHDKSLGFLAVIGIIGLAGVIVNSSIVLVSFIENLRENSDMSLEECLVKGASMRLRPILLTTITTVTALIPTAYGLGGYDPMLVSITLAMAWGLMFGTILTLIIVPCGYAVLEDFQIFVGSLKKYRKGLR